MKKLVIIFILSFVQTLYSQQANTYYVVGSGETLSTIALKYKLTPYDIIKLNPNAVNGVKEKEVLIIPKSVVISGATPVQNYNPVQQLSSTTPEKNQGTLLHIVQSKETKFGISRLYGVTITQLEEQNPQIVAGLQSGHKLKITGATTSYRQDLSKNTSVDFDSKFYYVVLPGETLYGISKRNGLTVDELIKANVSVLKGMLKSGQKITIPTRKGVSGSKDTNTSSAVVSSSSQYHLVVPKETKFGLSKKYGVTIEQLESLNPQIVNGLQIGQKIAVPTSYTGVDEVAPKEIVENTTTIKVEELKIEVKPVKVNLNQDYYVDYEVQPKETLFGLSTKAGMTVSEFIELNPKLSKAVQIGMIVRMPKNANVTSNVVSNVISEKVKSFENTNPQPNATNRYKDLSKTIDKSVKKQLSIILPFDDAKYKEYAATSNSFDDVQDEFLKSNLEFYSGALKAIDSAKTLGLNVDVSIAELQNNAEDTAIDRLVKGGIDKSNAVLMAFYDVKAQNTASALESQKIPVIANHISIENKNASNLYVAIPSESEIRAKVLEYLKTNDANVIVVNNTVRKQSKKAIDAAFPNAKFVKVSDRDVLDSEDLKELLVKGKLNYVILDTDLSSMIISSTNVLLKASTDFQIQIAVLEPSLLRNYENVSSIRINILKMIYPSYSSVEQALSISPKSTSNFLMGFDLTLDVMLRLAQNKDFETTTNEDVTAYSKYKFQYSKNKEGNAVNDGFYILQHDTDNKIKELK